MTLFPTNTGILEAEIRGDYAGLVYATVPHEINLVGRAGVEPATNGLKVIMFNVSRKFIPILSATICL